ncbi:MAG: type II toxin-antitoxin system RelE/ParE family toxin [Flavobacteriales bacterium]|nr:type II toxin-antitoxin system RelE/ParE family toxin [Flavobacteriales bacterium]
MEKVLTVEWTDTAKAKLRKVYEFHSEYSEESAFKIVNEIIEEADSIIFFKQFQVDDVNSKYRRIIVRQYKVLYKIEVGIVWIMNVFPTKGDPEKLRKL